MDRSDLYDAAKDELHAVSSPLFEFAEQQLAKRGAFLPFAATLESSGELVMHGATTGAEFAAPAEIPPLPHEELRDAIVDGTRAVGVCGWVKIKPEGGAETDAIKVLMEHSNGLVVAFYLPVKKRFLRGWSSGDVFAVPADAEIGLAGLQAG